MSIRAPYQHWLPGTEQNDSFWEGYTDGLNWPDHWKHTPGGPWVCSYDVYSTIEQKINAITSKECNLSWLEGWRQGKEKQCT